MTATVYLVIQLKDPVLLHQQQFRLLVHGCVTVDRIDEKHVFAVAGTTD